MRWARFLFYPGLAPLAVGTVVVVALFVLFLVLFAPPFSEPVIGPTPEQVEEHCQPVIEWILSEEERTGIHPEQIPSEHATTLDELPYSWSYSCGFGPLLSVGDCNGEWPAPLYAYCWSPNEWTWFADHHLADGEIRRLLEGHGYYQREVPGAVGQ